MSDSQSAGDATAESIPEDRLAALFVRTDGDRYAIESGRVDRVVETFDARSIPRLPPSITGVTDIDGEIVAVIDLSAVLGPERTPGETDGPVVLLHRDGDGIGLHIDAVERYVSVDVSHIESTDRPRRRTDGVDTPAENETGDVDESSDGTVATADGNSDGGDDHEGSSRGPDSDASAIEADSRWSRGIVASEGIPAEVPVRILDVPYLLETVANEPEMSDR